MTPGETCLPRPSISSAPAGAESPLPTAVIFPLTATTSAFSRIPAGPSVHTVAPLTITAPGAAGGVTSRPGNGLTSGLTPSPSSFALRAAEAGAE
jgi:hypothetical protein